MCILPSFSGITSSFGKTGFVSALYTTFPGRALLKTQAFLLEIRINNLVWDLWSICVCFSLVSSICHLSLFFFFQNSEMSDGKLSGDFAQCCSVPRETLQGAPTGQRLLAPPPSKEGQSPCRVTPGYQLDLKVSLDCRWTQVFPLVIALGLPSLLVCHLDLSLLSWGQQSGQLPSAWAKLRGCSLQSPTA